MAPTIISPNGLTIYYRWFMVPRGDYRLFAVKDGAGLTAHTSKNLRLVELTNPDTKSAQNFIGDQADKLCTESALSTEEAATHPECAVMMRRITKFLTQFTVGQLDPGARLYALLGVKSRYGTVKFRKGRAEVLKLNVDIEPVIEVPVVFHSVRHLAGGRSPPVRHAPGFEQSTLEEALKEANWILRQAAVAVTLHAYRRTNVNSDLGDVVQVTSKTTSDAKAILAHRDPIIPTNVFILGKIKNNQSTSGVAFDARDVFVEVSDSTTKFGRLLAHELTHVLGVPDRRSMNQKPDPEKGPGGMSPDPDNLMQALGMLGLDQNQIGEIRKRAKVLAPAARP